MVHNCCDPERLLANATVLLSGDHVGELSLRCFADVSCRSFEPSVLTSHRFVVALFASESHARTVNTTHWPSGDGTGSPTRCIRTMSCTPNGCDFAKPGAAKGVGNACPTAETGSATKSRIPNERMFRSPNCLSKLTCCTPYLLSPSTRRAKTSGSAPLAAWSN